MYKCLKCNSDHDDTDRGNVCRECSYGYHHCKVYERTLKVSLCYPRCEGNPNVIDIDLEDVRAADTLRLKYDFDRDGWAILQEKLIGHDDRSEETGEWVEVAFIRAWSLETDDVESTRNSGRKTGLGMGE